jgi:membrane protease YdiL (CAAX protease family)
MAVAALVWIWARGAGTPWLSSSHWLQAPYGTRLLLSLSAGLVLALFTVAVTPLLVKQAPWAARLHAEFRSAIGPLSRREIWLLALMSGTAEELLFRGALQPVVGLWLASLIFGGVHVGPSRLYLPWTLWAFVMGLLFGLIYASTGVLWGAILAHVTINQRNMRFIQRHDPVRSSIARLECDRKRECVSIDGADDDL